MKENKQSSLGRILGCAGGHRRLTALGCLLSALSAVLGLVPYVCVWLAARTALGWSGGAGRRCGSPWAASPSTSPP